MRNPLFKGKITLLNRERKTQEDLAEAVHISRNYLAKIETVSRTPNIAVYVDIAEYFGVTLDYLLLGKRREP